MTDTERPVHQLVDSILKRLDRLEETLKVLDKIISAPARPLPPEQPRETDDTT